MIVLFAAESRGEARRCSPTASRHMEGQPLLALGDHGAVITPTPFTDYTTNTIFITSTNDGAVGDGALSDTFLDLAQPFNDGRRLSATIVAGTDPGNDRHGLLAFDLSSVTGNVELVSAVLRLYANNLHGARSVAVYPMIRPWSWRYVCYNYNENTNWWNAGNQPFDAVPPTADYDTSAGVTNTLMALNQYSDWNVTGMVSNWLVNPASNHGVVLLAPEANSETKFYSVNETIVVGVRPVLVVTVRSEVIIREPTGLMLIIR